MSKLILNHPQKAIIDSVVSRDISSRKKAEILAKEHGISISHSILAKYHSEYLAGQIIPNDSENDNDSDGENYESEPIQIDFDKVQKLSKAINDTFKLDSDKAIKEEFSELFALQLAITKDALKKHIAGAARYPTEYIKNLQIISNLLTK